MEASKGGMKVGRIKDPFYKDSYFGITPATFIPPFEVPEICCSMQGSLAPPRVEASALTCLWCQGSSMGPRPASVAVGLEFREFRGLGSRSVGRVLGLRL